jgi:hypothetical protein
MSLVRVMSGVGFKSPGARNNNCTASDPATHIGTRKRKFRKI